MSVFVLADEHIKLISELTSVKDALSGLKNAKKASFTSELPTHIKDIIKVNIGLDLLNIKDVPMTWLVGDSVPHIDRGEKPFEKTYLIYLTDSDGELIVENHSYPIKRGFGVSFNEGLSHKTLNSGLKPRLILGPMSEQGFVVGTSYLYFYRSISDASISLGQGNPLNEVSSGNEVTISEGSWYVVNTDLSNEYLDANPTVPYYKNFEGKLFVKDSSNYYTFSVGSILPHTFKYNLAPASPICFVAGSIVETDQGQVKIEEVNISLHTISGEQIIGLVKSTGDIPCLAYIKKDLISSTVPDRDTYCSVWHKILFNGEMMEAQVVPGAQPYPYNKQTLYNILMEKHSTMKVNNMVVETLHPESPAAEMFLLTKK